MAESKIGLPPSTFCNPGTSGECSKYNITATCHREGCHVSLENCASNLKSLSIGATSSPFTFIHESQRTLSDADGIFMDKYYNLWGELWFLDRRAVCVYKFLAIAQEAKKTG